MRLATTPIWLRAFAFLVVVPGAVAGWIPWWIAGAPPLSSGSGRVAAQWLGAAFATLGATIVLWCTRDFVRRGRGTPAPHDPPVTLVTGGLYQVTRNPMYLGVLALIVGQALWFASGPVLVYAAAVAIAFHVRVLMYEEPRLSRSFGPAYAEYCARVSRWLPRLRRNVGKHSLRQQ